MHTRVKSEILALAQANPTQEVCGFIHSDARGRATVLPCANVSRTPCEAFEIDVQDHIRALRVGPQLFGVYHSHPGDPSGLSPADITYADELGLPLYGVNTRDGSWMDYTPPTYAAPQEGAPWCLGFADCWETPRIHYRQRLSIHLSDYDRDESMGHEDAGTILANYEREGFARLAADPSALREHDILMFRTNRAVPQHFAVFLGNSQMLHHVQDATSRRELLTDRWMSRLFCVFRHQSLV